MTRSLTALVAATVLMWGAPAAAQTPVTLVDLTTHGNYNASLGTALDGTQPQFPCANLVCGDPNINPAAEPNLSSVSGVLGGWLSTPPVLNANWTGRQDIPSFWAVNTETAVVYPIDAGATGLDDVTGIFVYDNGIFVWLDGVYRYGAVQPGAAFFEIDFGDLSPGMHSLQLHREDHGVAAHGDLLVTGSVRAAAVPVTKDDCKGAGWQSFGDRFKNQGDCIRFVKGK